MTTPVKRIPVRIRLPYATEDEFIERYGTNVGRGGIFIATRALKPEGTEIAFEFVLADGTRLLKGEGAVLKVQVDEGGGRSGMTVRFLRLDARSKALVDRAIAYRSGFVNPQPPDASPSPQAAKEDPISELARRAKIVHTSETLPEPSEPEPHPEPVEGREDPAVDPEPVEDKPEPADPDETLQEEEAPQHETLGLAQVRPFIRREGPSSDLVLGIDLGTTNSRVAVYMNGEAKLLSVSPGGKSFGLPSVVAVDDKGRFLVGARAKAQIFVDPKNTVFGAKRLMGRRARSKGVRELADRLPYGLVPDPEGDVGVELGGKVYSLPEIAALLLQEIKSGAEEQLGQAVEQAVLCVPAYFNDHQRSAVLAAGRLAGLKVLRILNEPSAIALAFGYGRGLARKRLLVYDLGGGTFDASVVEVTGDDIEVVSTGGDNFLGGMDFDSRIASELERSLDATSGKEIPAMAAQRIRDAA
jgi:uncharacterized protein (TIGR02266 family)